jgi:hypothetical protein
MSALSTSHFFISSISRRQSNIHRTLDPLKPIKKKKMSATSTGQKARVLEAAKYVTLLCFYQYEHGRWNESIHDAPDIFKCCYYLESIPNDRPEGLKTNADIFTKIEEASDVNSLANQFVFPFPFPASTKFVPRKLQFGQRRKCYKGGLQEQWNFLLKQAIDHLKVISKKSLSFAGLRLYVSVHWYLLEGEKSRMCPRSIADLTINPPSVEQDEPVTGVTCKVKCRPKVMIVNRSIANGNE